MRVQHAGSYKSTELYSPGLDQVRNENYVGPIRRIARAAETLIDHVVMQELDMMQNYQPSRMSGCMHLSPAAVSDFDLVRRSSMQSLRILMNACTPGCIAHKTCGSIQRS